MVRMVVREKGRGGGWAFYGDIRRLGKLHGEILSWPGLCAAVGK